MASSSQSTITTVELTLDDVTALLTANADLLNTDRVIAKSGRAVAGPLAAAEDVPALYLCWPVTRAQLSDLLLQSFPDLPAGYAAEGTGVANPALGGGVIPGGAGPPAMIKVSWAT